MDDRAPFLGGTKRSVSPEVTFERIQKHLGNYGITRLADVTGLDCLGIPVYTSMRPRGRIVHSAQGKGARPIDAKVSALMEAIEGFHAENPTVDFVHASLATLERAGRAPVDPTTLCQFAGAATWSATQKTLWVEAAELLTGGPCLVPASSVYFVDPALFRTSTNGLASGNDVPEATLHALLELYERDALSALVEGDEVSIAACDVIELDTIDEPIVREHIAKLHRAKVTLKLLRVPVDSPIHTFFAVILDRFPLAPSSHVSCGFGSHLSPTIAASRAITEAAQTRIAMIQSSGNFLRPDMYRDFHDQVFDIAMSLEEDTPWSTLHDAATATIAEDLALVLRQCQDEGAPQVLRHTLTPPGHEIVVVKVQVPGARDDFPM